MTMRYLAPAQGKVAQQSINQVFGDWREKAQAVSVQ
jgi:hypothetical protein